MGRKINIDPEHREVAIEIETVNEAVCHEECLFYDVKLSECTLFDEDVVDDYRCDSCVVAEIGEVKK